MFKHLPLATLFAFSLGASQPVQAFPCEVPIGPAVEEFLSAYGDYTILSIHNDANRKFGQTSQMPATVQKLDAARERLAKLCTFLKSVSVEACTCRAMNGTDFDFEKEIVRKLCDDKLL